MNTWFLATLDYALFDELSLSLGYYNLANQVRPDGNRASLRPAAVRVLQAMAPIVGKGREQVTVEGHADPHGSYEDHRRTVQVPAHTFGVVEIGRVSRNGGARGQRRQHNRQRSKDAQTNGE